MKFGVVVFPGSNCDEDMRFVLADVLGQEVEMLWHKNQELKGFGPGDCIVLPGGFSYGDYLRSGAIAKLSPIMQEVIKFANHGGYVIGICNGFQILCEAGLLPGVLLRNNTQKFICKNLHLKVENDDTPFTAKTTAQDVLKIPIAHADGRYFANPDDLEKLIANEQILFKYCEEDGSVTEASNPNGSLHNIAGICNVNKNVFGMMPHPERAAEEILGNTQGRILFESLIEASKQAFLDTAIA
jgi:phosphoribosylformylglycinamidine synthase